MSALRRVKHNKVKKLNDTIYLEQVVHQSAGGSSFRYIDYANH